MTTYDRWRTDCDQVDQVDPDDIAYFRFEEAFPDEAQKIDDAFVSENETDGHSLEEILDAHNDATEDLRRELWKRRRSGLDRWVEDHQEEAAELL